MPSGENKVGEKKVPQSKYSHELAASVKSLYNLTTRIDERVEQAIANNKGISDRLEKQVEKLGDLITRVSVLEKTTDQAADVDTLMKKVHNLELRVQSTEISSGKSENRWKTTVNFSLQLVWVIIAAYLLYKLGIQAPAVP